MITDLCTNHMLSAPDGLCFHYRNSPIAPIFLSVNNLETFCFQFLIYIKLLIFCCIFFIPCTSYFFFLEMCIKPHSFILFFLGDNFWRQWNIDLHQDPIGPDRRLDTRFIHIYLQTHLLCTLHFPQLWNGCFRIIRPDINKINKWVFV